MNRRSSVFILSLLILAPSTVALAQVNYIPITNMPFIPDGTTMTAEAFVTNAYRISVIIAAMLAVVRIIYGGVQWMLTDVITSKESAKKDIWGAIIGLIIVLSAVFILEIINPNLRTFNLFRQAPAINVSSAPASSAVAPANTTPPPPPPFNPGDCVSDTGGC